MSIGKVIKDFRKEHNLTQVEFAIMAGATSNTAISQMENSVTYNPTPDTLKGLANAMGMTTDALIEKASK